MSLTAAFDRHPELEFHAIQVRRCGRTILDRVWAPYRRDDQVLVYSASKTFTATAVGFAIAEGHLALDDRVVDLLGDAVPAEVDARTAQITVHHLLSMSTGHDTDTADAAVSAPPQEWVARVLGVAPAAPVGSRHVYNNGASFLLGELVRQRTGQDILEYLQPRLFEPLGITAIWERDGLGRCLGWSGLHVTIDGLAAMGELYRCDGVWQGRRILPEGWVQLATMVHIPTVGEDEAKPEWRLGYGYQLWRGREGYRLDGAYGQYSLVIPDRELVVAINSAQVTNQDMLDFVFEELLALLPTEPVTLPDAAIAVPSDTGEGTQWSAAAAQLDPQLVNHPDAEQINLPELTQLEVRRQDAGFAVRFVTDATQVRFIAGSRQWRRQTPMVGPVQVPVAAAAGATEDGSVVVWVVFTDTPHVLQLRVGRDGRAGMAWRTAPLGAGGLGVLRAG